ncbi:MAG: thiosulfate/3-mercaptopyruvate sulfurtransferase [Gammaproteobacteria bacterium]|jgi:thiosulfate/3-mercaptopyruvate sulfurtransferase
MTYLNPDALVSTDWLGEHLNDPTVRVIDCSWHQPVFKRDAVAEFADVHIPGAAYFNIDDIADASSSLPHMIPDAAKFSERVGKLGIGNDHHVIAYDVAGFGSAARVWWMFRLFGHDKVSVLNGGLPKWRAENRASASGAATPQAAAFKAQKNDGLVRSVEHVLRNLEKPTEQVLDARSAGRFNATEAEPRKGLRGGHIPNSFSRPFNDLYDSESKTMKSADDLIALFDEAGVSRDEPIVTSCGSGVTACNLALGLYLIGKTDVAVYDGSWTEWGGRDDTPIDP